MSESVSIIEEKSRLTALMRFVYFLFSGVVSFFVLSAICFGILDICCRLGFIEHYDYLHVNWQKFIFNPIYVFDLYAGWWTDLYSGLEKGNLRFILFVPFMVPVGIVLAMVFVLFTSRYSFSLWYVLNYHFAKMKDIEAMGLNKGVFMVLGKLADQLLGVRPSESVLCIGEMGCGKTSSVAVPSVLRSDNACVIAVDMTGLLPKFTSGYRAKIGKTVYYNWDLPDDPEKGIYYPRWNPLAEDNMPENEEEVVSYLKRIADYLVDVKEKDKHNYWNMLANALICAFLGYWRVKVKQARANDYFLNRLIEGKHLTAEEKDILFSYYINMPPQYTEEAMLALEENSLNKENYMPIGSWAGIPEQWIGKDVCFAAITDWMIENYMTSADENVKDWTGWIFSLIREAQFFDYDDFVKTGLKQILNLSTKQRQIVFVRAIKPFKIFTNQALRERTNGNDFNLDDIRGVYDEDKKQWMPVTVYSLANNYASKILNQMFLDEALYRNLNMKSANGVFPMIFVLDDVGHNLRLKNLHDLLVNGKSKKMSALLLCNSLSLVEKTYSKEELEFIIMNTSCKIVKAPNNKKLSRQLDKLAVFATKSVQIPQIRKRYRLRGKKCFADASFFHQLATDFNLKKNIEIDTRKHQVVLVEGYYHRPILAEQVLFHDHDVFRKRALFDAVYALKDDETGNKIDLETPKMSELFDNADLGVDDLFEFDRYFDDVFEKDGAEAEEKENFDKFQPVAIKAEEVFAKNDEVDWWLEEDAFDVRKNENPFDVKK